MKVLFDECVPKRLRRSLAGYDVTTVPEAGWAGFKNGALLRRAAEGFDLFVTVDRNIFFQQNPKSLLIPVIIIHSKSNKLADLKPFIPRLLNLLTQKLDKTIHHVGARLDEEHIDTADGR